jgi:hypothetical protein
MESTTVQRITQWIRGLALGAVGIAFACGGLECAIGAAAGGALALGNWLAIRWLAGAVLRGSDRMRARLTSLVVFKTITVMTLAAVLVRLFDPTGLVLGVSAFVLGLLAGALHDHIASSKDGDLSERSLPVGGS